VGVWGTHRLPSRKSTEALERFLVHDEHGTTVVNFMIEHGICTWHFYPPFVINCLFPDIQFIQQNEWDIFSPFAKESRRPKKGHEAIGILDKIYSNWKLIPSPAGAEGLDVDGKKSGTWTFKDFCGFVWRYAFVYETFGNPALQKVANWVTAGQFATWSIQGICISGTQDQFFGWKHMANILYILNLVHCHTSFVVSHIEKGWAHKIAAQDRADLKKFSSKLLLKRTRTTSPSEAKPSPFEAEQSPFEAESSSKTSKVNSAVHHMSDGTLERNPKRLKCMHRS
jgi:hypothetical protein